MNALEQDTAQRKSRRAMAEAGIRLRPPGVSDGEVRVALVDLLYGPAARARLAQKLGP